MENTQLVVVVSKPTDAPLITVDKYDAETEEKTADITGSIADATGTQLSLTINGSNVPVNTDGTFTATVDLNVGDNSFSLSAKNTYGNEGTSTVKIKRTEPEATPEPTPEVTAEPEATAEPTA
jgi:hypothetical protein